MIPAAAARARQQKPRFQLTLPPRELQPSVVRTDRAEQPPPSIDASTPFQFGAAVTAVVTTVSVTTVGTAVEDSGDDDASGDGIGELQPPGAYRRKPSAGPVFDANEIIPQLFLGSWSDAEDADELRRRGIRRIVNLAPECGLSQSCAAQVDAGALQVLRVNVIDHSDSDIAQHFQEACAFIHTGIGLGEGVLVHCRAGVSRSATIVMAYLMTYGTTPVSSPVASPLPASASDSASQFPCVATATSLPLQQQQQQASTDAAAGRMASFDSTDSDSAASSTSSTSTLSYDDAFDYVKARRPRISPNLGFVLALHDLDAKRSCASMPPAVADAVACCA